MQEPCEPSLRVEQCHLFKADFASAIGIYRSAAALAQLKVALNIEAEAAITNSIVYEPTYVAYNDHAFD